MQRSEGVRSSIESHNHSVKSLGRRTASITHVEARLLRCTDAAEYLGIGKKAIRALITSGELPYVQLKPGNSPYLIDVRDLDRFIEARKNTNL